MAKCRCGKDAINFPLVHFNVLKQTINFSANTSEGRKAHPSGEINKLIHLTTIGTKI
jgi:hypothetical protein